MRFGIVRATLGSKGFIDISNKEFRDILKAKRGLLILEGIEQKFNMVLGNYEQYESELLSISLRDMLFAKSSDADFTAEVYVVNRRLANLLASGRMYLNQLQADMKRLYGRRSSLPTTVKEHIAQKRHSSFGFQVIDLLRNYAQHRNMPVYQLSLGWSLDEASPSAARYSASPKMRIADLQQDTRLDQGVLVNLASKGPLADLTPFVRQYVEALGDIHQHIREATLGDATMWDSVVQSVLSRGEEHFSNGTALAIVRESDGEWVEEESIFKELTQRRELLQRRNRSVKGLAHRYVAAETQKAKAGKRVPG